MSRPFRVGPPRDLNEWQKYIEQRRASKFPEIKMAALRPCDDLKDKAFAEATAILNANPKVKLIMAICSPAVPAAARALFPRAQRGGRAEVMTRRLGPKPEPRTADAGPLTRTCRPLERGGVEPLRAGARFYPRVAEAFLTDTLS